MTLVTVVFRRRGAARRPERVAAIVAALIAAFCAGQTVLADAWEAELQGGGEISVDPRTNRVIIESGPGQGRPLWDGVHRLSDGSVITIHSGVMVPNEELLTQQHEEPAEVGMPKESGASCDDLVLRTCGLNDECAGTESCDLARQLRAMQWQKAASASGGLAWAASRCEQGLTDPGMFKPCEGARSLTDACDTLVERVCGSKRRCEASEACRLARELLDLDQTARREGADDHAAGTRRQCQEILSDHAFFPPCR